MKKLLTLILVLFNVAFASNNYELKLYESVIPSIFTELPIKIFVDNDTKHLLKNSTKFQIIDICDDTVTILIGKDFNQLTNSCKKKPVFSTSYRGFKNNKNSFGAFYWRKGRPQIRFKQDGIDKYSLILPANLKRFIK